MPDKQDPKGEDPHPDGGGKPHGLFDGLSAVFFRPKEDVEHVAAEADHQPATSATAPTTPNPSIAPAAATIQVDQGKLAKFIAAVTQKHPMLVVLSEALEEARGLELDQAKTAKMISMRLTKQSIGIIPLLEECTKADNDVDAERQAFLKGSEARMDQEVGSIRREAEGLAQSSQTLRDQIKQIEQQIADQEQRQGQLVAQADEAERVHKEGDVMKLAMVAAAKQHFSALKDMIQRTKGN